MVLNHCGVVPTVLRVLVPEVGDWNWEMESRTGCRDGSGKDKPGKGRPAVAVRRQETIWNLLQEMDSKGNPYCGSYSGSYSFSY